MKPSRNPSKQRKSDFQDGRRKRKHKRQNPHPPTSNWRPQNRNGSSQVIFTLPDHMAAIPPFVIESGAGSLYPTMRMSSSPGLSFAVVEPDKGGRLFSAVPSKMSGPLPCSDEDSV